MGDVDAPTRPGIRPQGPYWPSLDGIRGFFMVFVFLYHVWPPLLPGASVCVDSFFVLSAFLITVLLVRERERTGRVRIGRFYVRRALRLLPVLFVVVPVAATVAWFELPELRTDVWPAARSTLLYYANFRAAAHPTHMAVFLPTWSLSTEEQFYVVWPSLLVLMLALRWRPRTIVAVSATLLTASVVWLQVARDRGAAISALYYRPDLRVTGILVGTTLGLLYAYDLLPAMRRLRAPLLCATVVGLGYVFAFIFHPQFVPARYQATLAIAVACLAWGAVILQQVLAPIAVLEWVWANPVTVWLGKTSYTLYLVHVPVIRTTRQLLGHPRPVVTGIVAGAVTLIVTTAIHYAIERPALRLKDRRMEPPAGRPRRPRLPPWRMKAQPSTSTSSSES
jgi:peptidoglycan/LPS O-acetylase OafA/YrhL